VLINVRTDRELKEINCYDRSKKKKSSGIVAAFLNRSCSPYHLAVRAVTTIQARVTHEAMTQLMNDYGASGTPPGIKGQRNACELKRLCVCL
jgi:hypothetical protein